MTYEYTPKGVCAKHMTVEVEDGKVVSLQVRGGCSGNLQGITNLVIGMEVEEVISRLEGVCCGAKPTSCPDQLSKALREATEA